MTVNIYHNYEELSLKTAEQILAVVTRKPDAVLCLATGDTPVKAYEYFTSSVLRDRLDLSGITFIGLDEWVGLGADTPGSCIHFLNEKIFSPLGIAAARINLFNGQSNDLHQECRKMDEVIRNSGGIDFMLVGLGVNGHIGFNEPFAPRDLESHVAELDPLTQQVGQKYFQKETRVTQGITLGFKHIMRARTVMLMANGERKSGIVRRVLEGPDSIEVPATILRQHSGSVVNIDESAAKELSKEFRDSTKDRQAS